MTLSKPWTPALCASLILTVMGATCVLSLHVKSPTVDEFAHLPAGYYYWKTGDFSLYDKNPPFVRLLCALPLLREKVSVDWTLSHKEGGDWRPWVFGTHFMNHNKESYDHLFFIGRLPVVVLALLLGFFVFQWAMALYGPAGAIISLVFYAFSPNILAHAGLVTTDLGFTCFMFLSLYFSWKTFFVETRWNWIAAGIFLGLALLSKFTGLLLIPLLVFLFFFTRRPVRKNAQKPLPALSFGKTWVVALWHGKKGSIRLLALIVMTSLIVVHAGYGFQGSLPSLSDIAPKSRFLRTFDIEGLNKIPLPFPAPYIQGLDRQKIDAEQGEFLNYLRGAISAKGWWYYFIYAFFVKVPMAVLAALALSAGIFLRSRRPSDAQTFLMAPVLFILVAFSFFNELNIGLRYILPVFPFLFVWFGSLARLRCGRRADKEDKPGKLDKAIVIAILIAHVVASYSIFPDYLAFFNTLAGGPKNGPRHLLDSNLDWGQDLKQLKTYMQQHGIEEIGLAYFGHVDPAIYGISYYILGDQPKTGPVAVSAHFLFGLPYVLTYADPPQLIAPGSFQWLQNQEPIARIGYSIYVFYNHNNETVARDAG